MPSIDVGGRGAHEARLELLTVGMVVDPFPRSRNPLACRDHGGVADYRDRGHDARVPGPQEHKSRYRCYGT